MGFKTTILLHPFLRSFVLYQLVFAGATRRKKQIQINANVNANANASADFNQHHDHPPRYWPRYSGTRHVRILDGVWNASRLESPGCNGADINNCTRFDSLDPNIDISKIQTVEQVRIPSTIEVIADPEHGYLPGYKGYRGVSFFRTHFQTDGASLRWSTEFQGETNSNGPAARILFQACSFYCRVWLNGVEVGDHTAGGYVAWWLDISDDVLRLGRTQQNTGKPPTPNEGGAADILTHELFVLVDNRFNSTTAPTHTGGDFWHYGGIMRSVEWHDRPYPTSTVKAPKETKVIRNGDAFIQGDSGGLRTAKQRDSNVTDTASSGDVKRALTGDQNQPISSFPDFWPWRLYVAPQKDLQSVELSLQIVQGGNDGKRKRTDADLLVELSQKNQLKIFFDGNASKNALDDILLTEIKVDRGTTAAGKGSDLLLGLGVFSVPNPRTWSTSDPQLHTVSVDLNGAIVTERFGLRFWDTSTVADELALSMTKDNFVNSSETTITGASSRIRLNGKVLKLMGWNHHTQWPYTAASPTDQQLDEDIRLLKESGHANFVRGAHYPQDPRWLDRLDEHGIVVWCETLGPSVSVTNLQDDYFLKAQNQQINEMLDNDFNHASIAFWGFFNEGPSNHEEACRGYQASSDAIQARDTTRFVTYASNQPPPRDVCYEAATVISYNGYPGWYATQKPEDYWNSLEIELHSGRYPSAMGKPLLISETGAAGIYEWKHNSTAVKWTLGYQSDIITRDVATAIENANISGIALWHFFDFKVDDKWENNTHCDYLPDVLPKTCGYIEVDVRHAWGRPGGANHKGSVDFFRRPKPVFSAVALQFEKL